MSTWSAAPDEEPYADEAAIEADFEAPEADLAEQVRPVFVEEEKGRPSDDPEVAEADAQEQGVVVSLDEDSYR
jgi:hypothetical protein